MIDYENIITEGLVSAIKSIYNTDIEGETVIINPTKKEFEGDYTVVLFPYVKQLKSNPQEMGKLIGDYLIANVPLVSQYNVVKGFLNLSLSDDFWLSALSSVNEDEKFGVFPSNGKKVMVEYSSPNTNKPLHLGHIRNILLGWSSSMMLEAAGYEVIKAQIVNDRGIAVCKSMLAWTLYGNGETPQSTESKGDHFVGKYYVLFDVKLQEEYDSWQLSSKGREVIAEENEKSLEEKVFFKNYKNEYFNTYSLLGTQAKEMLLKWEDGDEETRGLWEKMNNWVYSGFNETYEALGVSFDKLYYESDTYLLGKESVEYGVQKDLFYKKEDGSIWVDLEDAGYDQKILLRSDGTSVYMTQDLGTAMMRYKDYGVERMIYVVGDEQDYHFQVLFEILKRLEEPYADNLHHLSYGMVDLPEGRMKSREGTVVDADDLIAEVIAEAQSSSEERGELAGRTQEEQEEINRKIGLAALKFFITKVTPKKRMTFNPKESVDMHGQTGPYIQNAYVRIQSILRKQEGNETSSVPYTLHNDEKLLIKRIISYPQLVIDSAEKYDPSDMANFMYNLAKSFHRYYHDFRILSAESEEAKLFRIKLIKNVAKVLKHGMKMLGIEMPERM